MLQNVILTEDCFFLIFYFFIFQRSNQPESLPAITNSFFREIPQRHQQRQHQQQQRQQQQQQQQPEQFLRRTPYKSVDSLIVEKKNRSTKVFEIHRPNSSSSEASETDVDTEVNKLKLR
jgi:hypothetical protein